MMRHAPRAIALAGVVLFGAACGRPAGVDEAREQAYRANNRGVAALEQFDYATAAGAFQEALRIDPELALARVNLSLALLYTQDLAGAAREATEAARLLPEAPQPHYILGLIARAENRTADAVREFTRVRQMDPADVGARINLGQILLEQRQFGEAAEMLRGAADAEPVNVTAAYNLGLALVRGGQTEEGQRALDRAQSLRSTGYSITYGTGYLEQGRYAEGLASTGAEPDLVSRDAPATRFAPAAIAAASGSSPVPSPIGRLYAAAELTPEASRRIAAGLGGCVALFDADGDDDLDLFAASGAGQRLFSNDGQASFTDITSSAGLTAPPDGEPVGCVAGDYDNDGRADLFVLRYGASSLYRNEGGRFTDAARAAGLPPYPYLPGAAAMADVDHDGDLDAIIAGLADLEAARARGGSLTFPRDFPPAPVRLLRNNGNGTFTDHTAAARLQAGTRAVAIVPTDFDNRRDVDLLIVNRVGPPHLFKNLRDGTFQDVAGEVGLLDAAGTQEIAAVAAADANKDDFTDFFFARPSGGVFAMSDGRGRFRAAAAPDAVRTASAAQFVDADSDGLSDLLAWSDAGARLVRNVGSEWQDVSASVFSGAPPPGSMPSSARAVALGDLNGDARTDLVTAAGQAVTAWVAGGSTGNRGLRIAVRGRVSNRMGIGSKVHVRAGSLSVRVEPSAATPPVTPADIVVGLGPRPGADTVRVLWPSGILQAEVRDVIPSPFPIQELDRKPSSCPFLFTWNGERFEFVTDFLGAGEMGYWQAPNLRNTPDPVEYVRIAPHQLREKNGRFELRVTNELEETLYLDSLQLITIEHPETVSLFPDEGMTAVPKPFRLLAVTSPRTPRAIDDQGRDQTDRIEQLDRRYADGFALERLRGYAAPHSLTLDLAPLGPAPVLLLTAWTDYAFSSDNVAAEQAGLTLLPPKLEVREPSGRWRTVLDEIGIPVGRPQTVTVDLRGRLRAGEHLVRVVTSMRIYWDQIRVATAVEPMTPAKPLDPVAAVLRERGFSAEVRPGGEEPPSYDFDRVSARSEWKAMTGRFTRLGDVRPLLVAGDDMFVIAKPGDEIALAFEAASGSLPEGWTRTFLLRADGFSKEMDVNSASPDTVEPLPFHRMSGYPYGPSERYAGGPAYEEYRSNYNTRAVVKAIPSIDGVTRPRGAHPQVTR